MSSYVPVETGMSLQQALQAVEEQLTEAELYYGHGTDNPGDEAFALIFQTLDLSFDEVDSLLEKRLAENEVDQINDIVSQRIETRQPLPYLLKQAYFFGLPFYVDERVIIPRSSIGELIEDQFHPWITQPESIRRVLDLCTGSGALAVACAYAFETAMIYATDIDGDALNVAHNNVERHQLQEQVKLIESDLFEDVPEQTYDIIVTNPPYVGYHEQHDLPAEYSYEPDKALFAQDQGLALAKQILEQARSYLSQDGLLVMEVGQNADLLGEALPQVPFIWLSFEDSEGGVCLLTAQQLKDSGF